MFFEETFQKRIQGNGSSMALRKHSHLFLRAYSDHKSSYEMLEMRTPQAPHPSISPP